MGRMIDGWRDNGSREHYRSMVPGHLIRIWAFTAETRSLAGMEVAMEAIAFEHWSICAFEHLWRLLFYRDTPTAISLLACLYTLSGVQTSIYFRGSTKYS